MYSVGDKVLITSDPNIIKHWDVTTHKYAGKIATIEVKDGNGKYFIDLDRHQWSWLEREFVGSIDIIGTDHEALFLGRGNKGG